MRYQDKFILLIRKSKAFICILVDDRSHKSTSPNCWCFRTCVSYSAAHWLWDLFLIRRLNSARMPDASSAAPLVMLFDSSYLSDISGHCSTAPGWGLGDKAKVTQHLMAGSHFSGALMGLVPFQTKRFKIFRGMRSTSSKRCRSKNVLWYFTARNTSF